ncbi:hypothetical protein F5Y04DRAFT_254495, partial [Hypomontagnella monticulosa]
MQHLSSSCIVPFLRAVTCDPSTRAAGCFLYIERTAKLSLEGWDGSTREEKQKKFLKQRSGGHTGHGITAVHGIYISAENTYIMCQLSPRRRGKNLGETRVGCSRYVHTCG